MVRADITILVELGLLELTAATTDGNWQEFQLTGNGRIMAKRHTLQTTCDGEPRELAKAKRRKSLR